MEVFPHLNKAYSLLHNIIRKVEFNEVQDKNAFAEFCTLLAQAFYQLKGVDCHVCIKVIVKTHRDKGKITPNKIKANTFVRDTGALGREMIDNIPIDHIIQNNTDYETIFKNIHSETGNYFLCNNLVAQENYKNTSFFDKSKNRTFTYTTNTMEEREKQWPLKYRSTLVAPIYPGIHAQRNHGTLIGFLCVDSIEKNIFNAEIDAELLTGSADAIYNPLRTFITKSIKNDTEKKAGTGTGTNEGTSSNQRNT